MKLLCIDPGTEVSGALVLDTETKEVSWAKPEIKNEVLIQEIPFVHCYTCERMAFEMIAGMGMSVGATTFETVLWMGRFIQAFGAENCDRIYRRDVKLNLCGSSRAKDKNVRQAILDLYPAEGGGTTPQIGTKKQPGPLYGVSKHAWSALAVGLTWIQQREEEKWRNQMQQQTKTLVAGLATCSP